ncbi:class I SAM-dependent methyltransferase [Actinomyces sp. 2119]|uniref:daptide-type RiPP biosynthesis methyltransferase n=1 Tax=Actinomyces sp. 2119 TaxID=2321393 RepID=UPI000E6C9CFD|nr:daptide-type RiPP biosynthesis methyltransferase [Actinomyces sp. 2119]RJF43798.1 class I SAM-dependent methyltransferase [Actinomyces sp. 2119]
MADITAETSTAPTTSVPSLYTGTGAHRYHRLSLNDDAEIAVVLDLLRSLPDSTLADLRVLELACGSGRVTLPMATAGHRVLATDLSDDMLGLLRKRLSEPRLTPADVAERIEIRNMDMTTFNLAESFKAVCLPTASVALLSPEQRRRTIHHAASHLPAGGVLVISTENVLPEAEASTTIRLQPGVTITEEIDHEARRRRTTVRWEKEEYVTDLYLVTPRELTEDCRDAGLRIAAQHASPDPTLAHHVDVLLGAVK